MQGFDHAHDNVYAAFAARFPAPDRLFVEAEDGRRLTYGEIPAATARIANLLRRLGIGPGDRVAGLLDKSPEALLLYLGCCRAGAVYLPIHVELTPPEVDHILLDAEPRLLVCRPAWAERLRGWAAASPVRHLLTLDGAGAGGLTEALSGEAPEAPVAAAGSTAPNAIVYTSGTTGKPKGAILSNGLVAWNAMALAEAWGMTREDVLLHANPMAFGLFGTTTPVLAAGAAMRLLPKFETEAVLRALPGATMFAGVPTYYARLLAHPGFSRQSCRTMRLFLTGSAPMRADLFEAFRARTGHALLDRYGMTEALIIASMPLDAPRRPDASGLPLPGSALRLVDEAGAAVPPGAVGAIELRQPFPFSGYWRAPEKTTAAFRADGWFITGDFGRVDPDGYLCVLGRGTELIITGGFNVYPKEVEASLNAMPGIAEAAVFGVPHPDFGEAVVAAIQLEPDAPPFSEAAVRLLLTGELARYKVPKRIQVVPEMPRNTLGKIRKTLLQQRFSDLFAPEHP
ncbi:AMP-binding protein [Roseomonas hellenica]|uniref:AMP-binding protein n=1 Tax=Plastoroseomonas hellenica TaxID=2687306 RepID=A0ABS5EYV7_9PROT|nr:AMP-binding protein [Plastoroseomonas hellenica]MBR0665469.1 AMP-binding protein [Plastoroseomonas hellenica]